MPSDVSVLYREPKVLKPSMLLHYAEHTSVSVLYREPKVLKRTLRHVHHRDALRFQCSTVSRKY